MSNLPKFKNEDDKSVYFDTFTEKLVQYHTLMVLTKDQFFGEKYNFDQLDGRTLEVVRDITHDLMYKTENDFKSQFPEYKDEDDELFIPYRSFKENVTEAINEALDKRSNKEEVTVLGDK